jgi:hypothetical protein
MPWLQINMCYQLALLLCMPICALCIDVQGTWADLTCNVNVSVQGEMLDLKMTVNSIIAQLSMLANEVTHVYLEVSMEGTSHRPVSLHTLRTGMNTHKNHSMCFYAHLQRGRQRIDTQVKVFVYSLIFTLTSDQHP